MVAETIKVKTMTNAELAEAIYNTYSRGRACSAGEGVHAPTVEHYKKMLAEQHRRATERDK